MCGRDDSLWQSRTERTSRRGVTLITKSSKSWLQADSAWVGEGTEMPVGWDPSRAGRGWHRCQAKPGRCPGPWIWGQGIWKCWGVQMAKWFRKCSEMARTLHQGQSSLAVALGMKWRAAGWHTAFQRVCRTGLCNSCVFVWQPPLSPGLEQAADYSWFLNRKGKRF